MASLGFRQINPCIGSVRWPNQPLNRIERKELGNALRATVMNRGALVLRNTVAQPKLNSFYAELRTATQRIRPTNKHLSEQRILFEPNTLLETLSVNDKNDGIRKEITLPDECFAPSRIADAHPLIQTSAEFYLQARTISRVLLECMKPHLVRNERRNRLLAAEKKHPLVALHYSAATEPPSSGMRSDQHLDHTYLSLLFAGSRPGLVIYPDANSNNDHYDAYYPGSLVVVAGSLFRKGGETSHGVLNLDHTLDRCSLGYGMTW